MCSPGRGCAALTVNNMARVQEEMKPMHGEFMGSPSLCCSPVLLSIPRQLLPFCLAASLVLQ